MSWNDFSKVEVEGAGQPTLLQDDDWENIQLDRAAIARLLSILGIPPGTLMLEYMPL